MSEKRIKAKIAGRMTAAELVNLCEWEDGTGADFAESLLRELAELLPKRKQPERPEEKPVPIARLGQTKLEFGQHKGRPFDGVPLDYLDWLCGEQEESAKKLRAYLKHESLGPHRMHSGD